MSTKRKNPPRRATKASTKDVATTKPGAAEDAAKFPFTRDPRLPAVGTTLQRAYKKKVLEMTVREDGFEYAGETYRSLSQLARHVTGAKSINGYLFFGLTGTKKPAPAAKPTKGTPEQVASVAKARAARAAKVAARKAPKASS